MSWSWNQPADHGQSHSIAVLLRKLKKKEKRRDHVFDIFKKLHENKIARTAALLSSIHGPHTCGETQNSQDIALEQTIADMEQLMNTTIQF